LEIIPAIDLRGGKCVRLYQGDYARQQVFSDNPVATALRWQEEGAPRLHVVDLDGAASGDPANLDAIHRIVAAVNVPVQVGGGVRSVKMAATLLDAGVGRVVFGTLAVEQPEVVRDAVQELGAARVIVGVDARDGKVAVRGWKEQSSVDALDLLTRMESLGARAFIYTDIARDGTLTEPNYQAVGQVVARTGAEVIASGGVSRVEHIARLAELGVAGCIIGRALYTGDLNLADALAASHHLPGSRR